MKVTYTTRDHRFVAEFEGTQCEIFEQIAEFEEVFGENECVGPDGTKYENIRHVVRTDKEDNKYYEKVCMDEGAKYRKLSYGCHKKGGGLFPKRKDKDGNFIGWNGWGKYNKDTGKVE